MLRAGPSYIVFNAIYQGIVTVLGIIKSSVNFTSIMALVGILGAFFVISFVSSLLQRR